MKLVVDIETNGLHPSKVWCVVAEDLDTGVVRTFDPHHIQDAVTLMEKASLLILHNGIGFDLPVLARLHGMEYPLDKVYDTMIMSRLLKPDRGYHGLEAWGEKLGIAKVPDLDWMVWDRGLIHRCEVDVSITAKLYRTLKAEEGTHDWKFAQWVEQNIAHYHQRQEFNGVAFDRPAAIKLADRIESELDEVVGKLKENMPHIMKHGNNPTLPFLKNCGAYKKVVVNLYGEDVGMVVAPYTRVDIIPPNPSSSKQVKDMLFSLGWQPDEWNFVTDDNGRPVRPLVQSSPKLSDSSLDVLELKLSSSSKRDIPSLVKKRGMLQHRLSLLRNKRDETKGLIAKCVDGRVVAGGIPMGTPTGRYTHSNVVNIPKASDKVPYGRELRSLFIAGEGRELYGSDADALEARMDAHYTYPYDKGARADMLLEGDIHQKNADIWGVTRSIAKNGAYCLAYGGQAAKLASTLGVDASLGKKYYDMFWDGNDSLSRLNKAVQQALGKGYLIGIDGRKLFIRSSHSALNMLFQSAGSICVKLATIYMNEEMDKRGYDWMQVVHMHDEFLLDILATPKQKEDIKALITSCWIRAGEKLKFNIPITGDIQTGRTWADVH